MLDFEKAEVLRSSWKRDLVVVGIWTLWILTMTAFQTPRLMSFSALSFVLIYAAWTWSTLRASAWFLAISVLFSSVSLMPSGLLWICLAVVYLAIKLARYRFLVEQGTQLAVAIFSASLLLNLMQAVFLGLSQDFSIWSTQLVIEMFSQAIVEAILASMLFRPLKSIQAIR